MTTALARRHPGVVVASVDVVDVDDGTTNRARLRLQHKTGEGPETVFVKAPPRLAHRLLFKATGVSSSEARVFACAEQLPIEMPLGYASVWSGLRELVVLEDVAQRGGIPNHACEPLDVEAVGRGLDGLASLHSRFWGRRLSSRPELAWLRGWGVKPGQAAIIAGGSQAALRRKTAPIPAEVLPTQLRNWRTITRLWARACRASASGKATLLHGDAHVGNSYRLPGNSVGFYDWQAAHLGSWEHDVGYFMVSALDVADRRAHERDLLDRYLAGLRLGGIEPPTTAEAWARYRRTPGYGLGAWVCTLGFGDYQRDEISLATIGRFAAACVDLDTDSA